MNKIHIWIIILLFVSASLTNILILKERETLLKNGIVIQTLQGILDDNGFEEKRIYLHNEDDQDWKIVYIFRFKFEESPNVMLGQPVQFSIVKLKEYLLFNDKTFVPYLVEKQRN